MRYLKLITPPLHPHPSPPFQKYATAVCWIISSTYYCVYFTWLGKHVDRSCCNHHHHHTVLFTNHIPGLAVSFEVGALLRGFEVRVCGWVVVEVVVGRREGLRGWELVLSQTLGWINKPGNIKSPFPLHLWTCALDYVNIHHDIWTELALTQRYTLRPLFLLCNSRVYPQACLRGVQRIRNKSSTDCYMFFI